MADKIIIKNLSPEQLKEALADYALKKTRPGFEGRVRVRDFYTFAVEDKSVTMIGARVEVTIPE